MAEMSLNVLTNYQTEEVISLHYHCLEIDVNGCEMDVNKKKNSAFCFFWKNVLHAFSSSQ